MEGDFYAPCWFSLNNSETVKVVTLASAGLQILGKFQTISGFLVNPFINENCYNSRPSNDIDMKLEPVTKFDKRNKTTSKKFDDDVMPENCDVIVTFLIYGQFGTIRKPNSGRMACSTYIFINSNLLSHEN